MEDCVETESDDSEAGSEARREYGVSCIDRSDEEGRLERQGFWVRGDTIRPLRKEFIQEPPPSQEWIIDVDLI